MRIARLFLSTGLLLLAIGLPPATAGAPAQLASQTALVGTVTDSAGLVVPGAQVVAVNVGTRDTYETTTNTEGHYNIQFVRPGMYQISVTLSGFQTFKATGVDVAGNQVVRTNAVMRSSARISSARRRRSTASRVRPRSS